MNDRIDFEALAKALLPYARELVVSWLPGGKMRGVEYVIGSLRGEAGDSLSINLNTGAWADFAGTDKGGDLISLYAAINSMSQLESAKKLAKDIGFTAIQQEQEAKKHEPKIGMPPPGQAKPSMSCHFGDPSLVWTYKNDRAETLFHIARYDPSNERKQFLPWTWDLTNNRWCMKAYPEPRPLYGLDLLAAADADKPVLLVEGEKACDAARTFINAYVVMTWPGGARAVSKVDFKPISGRSVLLWPDADEPGRLAMEEIARQIVSYCKEVKVINATDQPAGWDAADAKEQAWDWGRFMDWAKPRAAVFGVAQIVAPHAPTDTEEDNNEIPASIQAAWDKLGIGQTRTGQPVCNVDNALRVLEGWEPFNDLCWFDTFHQKILTRWKTEAIREWSDIDDLRLTQFMQRSLGLKRIGDDMVHKAIRIYAHNRQRNEPRDWLNQIVWDQKPRIEAFLSEYFGAEDNDYARAVGKNFWIGMAARIFHPGCKLDNMMILEGPQGKFKSTSLAIIGGQWYTEVQGAAVASKDFFMVMRGKLIVCIDEMHNFSKAEVSAVKQIVTSTTDRYRAPYGRSAEDHPRSSVFVGTTNESEYLRDNTGARRFWPIKCGVIDKEKIRLDRSQLFAEAVARFKRGEAWYEMPAEITEREQEKRRTVDEWENIIEGFLVGRTETTIGEVAGHMKIDAVRLSLTEQRRIAAALRLLGWERRNVRDGSRVLKSWYRTSDVAADEKKQEANGELPLNEEAPF